MVRTFLPSERKSAATGDRGVLVNSVLGVEACRLVLYLGSPMCFVCISLLTLTIQGGGLILSHLLAACWCKRDDKKMLKTDQCDRKLVCAEHESWPKAQKSSRRKRTRKGASGQRAAQAMQKDNCRSKIQAHGGDDSRGRDRSENGHLFGRLASARGWARTRVIPSRITLSERRVTTAPCAACCARVLIYD